MIQICACVRVMGNRSFEKKKKIQLCGFPKTWTLQISLNCALHFSVSLSKHPCACSFSGYAEFVQMERGWLQPSRIAIYAVSEAAGNLCHPTLLFEKEGQTSRDWVPFYTPGQPTGAQVQPTATCLQILLHARNGLQTQTNKLCIYSHIPNPLSQII